MTKLLTIDLRSTAPRMLGSRGTPSQLVLYGLKNMCAKFDAFTRFVTIFPLTDRTSMLRLDQAGNLTYLHLKVKHLSILPETWQVVWYRYYW